MKKPSITKEQFKVVKATRLQNKVQVTYHDVDGREVTLVDTDTTPSPDLGMSFNKMKEHMSKIYKYDGSLDNIAITGFSIKHGDDNEIRSFVVKGQMKFDNGKTVNIATPSINAVTEESGPEAFGFEDGMTLCLGDCVNELYEFFFKGKQAQMEMDFESVEMISDEVDEN